MQYSHASLPTSTHHIQYCYPDQPPFHFSTFSLLIPTSTLTCSMYNLLPFISVTTQLPSHPHPPSAPNVYKSTPHTHSNPSLSQHNPALIFLITPHSAQSIQLDTPFDTPSLKQNQPSIFLFFLTSPAVRRVYLSTLASSESYFQRVSDTDLLEQASFFS